MTFITFKVLGSNVKTWHLRILSLTLGSLPILPIWRRALAQPNFISSAAILEVILFFIIFIMSLKLLSESKPRLLKSIVAFMWLFTIIVLIQIWHSPHGIASTLNVYRLYLEPIIIFIAIVSTTKNKIKIAKVIAYTGLIICAIGCLQLIYPEWIFRFHLATGADPVWLKIKSDFTVGSSCNRIISIIDDANVAGQIFVSTLCAQMYLLTKENKKRWLYTITVSLIALLGTGSRSGMLSFSISTVLIFTYYRVYLKKSLNKIIMISLILVLIISVVLTVPELYSIVFGRVKMFSLNVMSADMRLSNWQLILQELTESPIQFLFGNGLTPGDIVTSRIAENAYISLLRDFGVVGILTIGICAVICFHQFARNFERFSLVVMITFAVANLFGDYTKIPMVSSWYVGLIAATYRDDFSTKGANHFENSYVV